jgi:hypothetical protein
MNQLLQWIGTFASIISVPLAIYFYFKTMDGKYEKVRKELIDLFSNYIGSGNKLTYFYLSSVINAKVRENNIKLGYITEKSIIEDLIVEIISNSLLSNDAKCVILKNLEELISEKELGDVSEEQQSMEYLKKGETTGFKISKMIKTSENAISTIISWVGIVAAILSSAISTGEITEIFSSIDLSSPIIQILIGTILTIIVSIIFSLIEKILKRK